MSSGSNTDSPISTSSTSSASLGKSTSSSSVVISKAPEVSATMSSVHSTSTNQTKTPINGATTLLRPAVAEPSASHSTTSISTESSSRSSSGPSTTLPSSPLQPSPSSPLQPSSGSKTVTNLQPPKTTTKISIEKAATPTTLTRTSTITDQPVSTLSSPVPVSIVDPNNGRVSLTTPPVVTVLSTSTEPNGEFVTFTHVVANPTSFNNEGQVSNSTGFLGNHGAIAGVFVVVGVIACAIGFCLVLLFRRRRRQIRRRRWLASIQQRTSSNPFEDPPSSPQMRSINDNRQDVNWDGSAPFAFGHSANTRRVSLHSANSHRHSDNLFEGTGSRTSLRRVPVPLDNLFDNQEHNRSLGFGVGYGRAFTNDPRDRVSIAQSSPSIYPASLPPSGDDDTTDAPQSPNSEPSSGPPCIAGPAPPRPPRSHLRRSVIKHSEMCPITPPTSISSHAPSKPPSPVLDQGKFINRRTLLDVRPRSSHDPVVVTLNT